MKGRGPQRGSGTPRALLGPETQRLRILLLSDEPADPSMGGPRVALRLEQALRALGHTCDLAFRPDLGRRPRSERLRLAVSPWLAQRAVARLERERGRYDVIDAASAEGWLLAGERPVVARSHGLEHRYYRALLEDAAAGLLYKPWTHRQWYPAVRLSQVERALRRARRVIALNPGDRDEIVTQGWAAPGAVEVIAHGVDAARWATAPAADAPRGAGILFCGWWTTSKGVGYLAEAYSALWRRGAAVPMTLFGVGRPDAHWPGFEARVRAAFPPGAAVTILPRTEDDDAVQREYARHDVLVCPSTSEGFGMVITEALSQRLPVICSESAGAAQMLRDGEEVIKIPARNAEALADAVMRVLTDSRLRHRLAAAGHARTADLHWDTIAARTLACYRRALG